MPKTPEITHQGTYHVMRIDEIKNMIRQELLDYMRDHQYITGFREAEDGFLIDVNSEPKIAIQVKAVEKIDTQKY